MDRETARAQHGHAFAVRCGVPGVQGTGPLVPAKPRRACAALALIFGKIPPRNGKWPAAGTYQDAYPREHVLGKVDELRRSLQLDTIPVLQLHVWNDTWTDDPDFRSPAERLKEAMRRGLEELEELTGHVCSFSEDPDTGHSSCPVCGNSGLI